MGNVSTSQFELVNSLNEEEMIRVEEVVDEKSYYELPFSILEIALESVVDLKPDDEAVLAFYEMPASRLSSLDLQVARVILMLETKFDAVKKTYSSLLFNDENYPEIKYLTDLAVELRSKS